MHTPSWALPSYTRVSPLVHSPSPSRHPLTSAQRVLLPVPLPPKLSRPCSPRASSATTPACSTPIGYQVIILIPIPMPMVLAAVAAQIAHGKDVAAVVVVDGELWTRRAQRDEEEDGGAEDEDEDGGGDGGVEEDDGEDEEEVDEGEGGAEEGNGG